MKKVLQYSNPEQLIDDMINLQKLRDGEIDFSDDSELMIKIRNSDDAGNELTFSEQVCKYYDSKGMIQTPEKFRVCLKYEIDRLLLIYRYAKLILFLSESKTVANEPVKNATELSAILEYVINVLPEAISTTHVGWKSTFKMAAQELRKIFTDNSSVKSRSTWYDKIDEECSKQQISDEVHDFEILVVDVCYNFTLECSIKGIDSTFDYSDKKRFNDDFINRMNCYYKMYCHGIHKVGKFYKLDDDQKESWNWKQLAQIRDDVYKLDHSKKQKPMSWLKKVRKTQKNDATKVFIGSTMIFIVVDLVVNGLFDNIKQGGRGILELFMLFQMAGSVGSTEWGHVCIEIMYALGSAIVKTLVIGLIISLINKKWDLSDILDIITEWNNKLSNWKMFKQRKLENEKLEEQSD